jgi:quercetin dioxygenase-like cupin family protein
VEPPFSYRLLDAPPERAPGATVRIVDSTNFPVARTIATALVEVEPGGLRELHWHPNADEWQYYIEGPGRMTVFASEGKARTFDYRAGDVGYWPRARHRYERSSAESVRSLTNPGIESRARARAHVWICDARRQKRGVHAYARTERCSSATPRGLPRLCAKRSSTASCRWRDIWPFDTP